MPINYTAQSLRGNNFLLLGNSNHTINYRFTRKVKKASLVTAIV